MVSNKIKYHVHLVEMIEFFWSRFISVPIELKCLKEVGDSSNR